MTYRRISIARFMMIVALAAANCALVREVPWEIGTYPTIWAALGILDFLILWKLILRRTFWASHYTFLILFVPAHIVLVNLAAGELIHPTGPLIRLYQRITGDTSQMMARTAIGAYGDIWLAALMALLLAWSAGLLAGWLERRRGWQIAAFWRGSLVGFGAAALLAQLNRAVLGDPLPGSTAHHVNLVLLAVCMIVGGIVGLSRLKSDLPRAGSLNR